MTQLSASGRARTSVGRGLPRGKLIRYIVQADRRIVRLSEDNGAAAAHPPLTQDEGFESPVNWKWSLGGLLLAIFAFLLSAWKRVGRGPAIGLRWATVAVLAVAVAGCGRKHGSGDDFELEGTIKTLSQADTLLFTDQLGTLLSETDGNGTVRAEFAALPYGEARTNTTTQTEKYAGAPRDESVGLDQMGARFYAPSLRMWTSPDPVVIDDPEMLIGGEFATANPYAYANLNPVIAKDSDGNFWHIAAGAAVGAVFGGGMEAATQYLRHGEVKDWGRVGSAAVGGAVSGALTAAAPGVGFAARALSSSASSVAGGMTTRAIDSGGASVGSVSEIAIDATIGAVTAGRGSAKPKPHPKPEVKPVSKPPAVKAGGGAGGVSPRAARREAMREAGIPTSQQPVGQTSVRAPGNQSAGRQYTYEVPAEGGGTRTMSVQHSLTDRVPDHGPHWEAGPVKPGGQTDSLGRPRLTSDKVKIDE